MLSSTEKPPPDPPCPNLHQLEVDLFNSDLDGSNPPPKFSIRHYVRSTRREDIRKNWPFSRKSLRLCLKHGVSDLLPPFQSLDSVRNPPLMKCYFENSNSNNAGSRLSGFKPSFSNNVGEHLPVKLDHIDSSGSQEDKDFPSSKVRAHPPLNSVKSVESILLQAKAVNSLPLQGSALDGELQNQAKNCKLIVKLNKAKAVPALDEHSSLNSTALSETMASKVCPVCSTFSSSSNTTLNAHIDQCLSGVSTIGCTVTTKASKRRAKPRKTKSMVDIYATARCCTLEDLDRRNGTNWASNLGFQTQDSDECNIFPHCGVKKDEDAVYVDSCGMKFLSLSKFSDLPCKFNAKVDGGSRKLVKKSKETKFSSSTKPEILAKKRKRLKYSYGKQPCCSSSPNHFPEDQSDCQQRKQLLQGGYMEEDTTVPVKQYVGSKSARSDKASFKSGKNLQPMIVKNLRIEGTTREGSCIKSTSDSNSPAFSNEKVFASCLEWRKRKEKLPRSQHDELFRQPSMRRRDGFSLPFLDSEDCDGGRYYPALSNSNMKLSRKDGESVRMRGSDNQNDTVRSESFHCNKRKERNAGSASSNSRKYHQLVFSPAGKDSAVSEQPSSSCKKPSVMCASAHKKFEVKSRKNLNFKIPRLHYSSRSAGFRQDGKVEKLYPNAAQTGKDSAQPCTNRISVLKLRKEKGVFLKSGKDVPVTSKDFETSSESNSERVRQIIDSCMSGTVKEANVQDGFHSEPIREGADEEAFTAFSKSLDSAFNRLADPSDIESNLQRYTKTASDKHYTDKLLSGHESRLFFADKMVKNPDEGHGIYFVGIDPIPIPGPPGSFLPSPGRMSSEEHQGNSSLTTCRIPSCEDKHEFFDMDLSDSHVSSASTVSESPTHRFDSLSVLNLPEHSHSIQQERSDDPGLDSSHLPEGLNRQQAGCIDGARGEYHLPETTSQVFRGNQPCRCSRKEGALRNDSGIPSASSSNPVLRLMGKNLMVMAKDEQDHPRLLSNLHHDDFTARLPYEPRFTNHTTSQSPCTFESVDPSALSRQFPSNGFETSTAQGLSAEFGSRIEMNPPVAHHDSRHVNSSFSNQNNAQVVHTDFQVAASKGMGANSVQWGCSLKGSSVLHPNHRTVSSPSTAGHPRSCLYYTPGCS